MELEVAKLGKTVGLQGYVRLHPLTDFPEQFSPGATYHSRIGDLTIESVNKRGDVKFRGFDTKEDAAKLVNLVLRSTLEESEAACELGKEEYFWHDIVGLTLHEAGTDLGTVSEIERLPNEDHLLVTTSETIRSKYKLKRFLFPFCQRTIGTVDLDAGRIEAKGALEMIETIAS